MIEGSTGVEVLADDFLVVGYGQDLEAAIQPKSCTVSYMVPRKHACFVPADLVLQATCVFCCRQALQFTFPHVALVLLQMRGKCAQGLTNIHGLTILAWNPIHYAIPAL